MEDGGWIGLRGGRWRGREVEGGWRGAGEEGGYGFVSVRYSQTCTVRGRFGTVLL